MTEELSFEAYLSLSENKFQIYLLDKKSLKNIYKEEVYLENTSDLIDYNLLHSFLDKNIFKIEKLIGKFLRSIVVVIENDQTFNCSIGKSITLPIMYLAFLSLADLMSANGSFKISDKPLPKDCFLYAFAI